MPYKRTTSLTSSRFLSVRLVVVLSDFPHIGASNGKNGAQTEKMIHEIATSILSSVCQMSFHGSRIESRIGYTASECHSVHGHILERLFSRSEGAFVNVASQLSVPPPPLGCIECSDFFKTFCLLFYAVWTCRCVQPPPPAAPA